MIRFSSLGPASVVHPRHMPENERVAPQSQYRGLVPEGRMHPGQEMAVTHGTHAPTAWMYSYFGVFPSNIIF